MTEFKVGDRVRIIDELSPNYGCVTTVSNLFIYDWNKVGVEGGLKDDYYNVFSVSLLAPAEKTLDNLIAGDVLLDKYNGETTIQGRIGDVYITTTSAGISITYSVIELRESGFKLKPQIKEVTLEEVAEKFHVEEIRIKGDG